MLRVPCPFCGHKYVDEFECLDSGDVGTLHCHNDLCQKDFWFIFCECGACGQESVFTWESTPIPTALTGLRCDHCGTPIDEANGETESQDATRRIQ